MEKKDLLAAQTMQNREKQLPVGTKMQKKMQTELKKCKNAQKMQKMQIPRNVENAKRMQKNAFAFSAPRPPVIKKKAC